MKIIPVAESELKNLSLLNGLAALFLSLGVGFITFGLGIAVNVAAIPGQWPSRVSAMVYVVIPAVVVIGILFLALAVGSFWLRHGALDDLKNDMGADDLPAWQVMSLALVAFAAGSLIGAALIFGLVWVFA